MKLKILVFGMLIFTILTLGCINQKREIEFETLLKGLDSGYGVEVRAKEESFEEYSKFWAVVITDEKVLKYVWRNVKLVSIPKPNVDFEKNIVIVVFQGLKRTGGYSIEIKGIYQIEEKVYVEIDVIEPKEGEPVTQAFTSPFHAVIIEKSQIKPGTLIFIFKDQNGNILQEITIEIS